MKGRSPGSGAWPGRGRRVTPGRSMSRFLPMTRKMEPSLAGAFSRAVRVDDVLEAAVVPLMRPVVVFKLSPAGRFVAEKLAA